MIGKFQFTATTVGDKKIISLSGTFDGTSAYEVLNYINDDNSEIRVYIVNFEKIKRMYVFGDNVYRNGKRLIKGKTIIDECIPKTID